MIHNSWRPALRIGLTAAALVVSASFSLAQAQHNSEVSETHNLSYYDGPDRNPRRNVLDLYLPKAAKDFPVVVFVHGGGWTMGSKDYFVALRNHPGSEFGRFLARNGVGA